MATKKRPYKTIPIADARVEASKARTSRAAKKKASRHLEEQIADAKERQDESDKRRKSRKR
jgi:hypothetical protein